MRPFVLKKPEISLPSSAILAIAAAVTGLAGFASFVHTIDRSLLSGSINTVAILSLSRARRKRFFYCIDKSDYSSIVI